MKTENFKAFQQESLQKQIDSIRGLHLRLSFAQIAEMAFSRAHNIIVACADPRGSTDFWRQVGYPELVRAYNAEMGLARFREALESPDFAYVTSGHSVSPDSYHIYRRDAKSPSGRVRSASASKYGYVGDAARKMLEERGKTTRLSGSYTHDYR